MYWFFFEPCMTPTFWGTVIAIYFDHGGISYSFRQNFAKFLHLLLIKASNTSKLDRLFFHQVGETEVGEIHSSHGQEGQLHIFHQASSSQPFRMVSLTQRQERGNGANSTGWEKTKKGVEMSEMAPFVFNCFGTFCRVFATWLLFSFNWLVIRSSLINLQIKKNSEPHGHIRLDAQCGTRTESTWCLW